MRIGKMSEESQVPDWVVKGSTLEAIERNAKLIEKNVDRINATAAEEVMEQDIVEECDHIEKCASSGKPYFFNSNWKQEHISHLKEYACVCGIDKQKVVGIDPTELVKKEASSKQMVKIASVEESTLEEELKNALGDPFHIEERINMDHMEKENWEVVKRQAEISNKISMDGSILPLRGGENYNISNTPSLPSNQNSIHNPNAIQELASSKSRDNGTRLAEERKAKEAKIKQNHSDWEQSKIQAMSGNELLPHGVVFPTEVMNAQSGISDSVSRPSVYAKFDPDLVPEKTEGETISERNNERRASIQREEKENREWEELKAAPTRSISDTFSSELKKFLK